MQKILRIDPKDNLIVALRDLAQGDIIENDGQRIQLVTDVPAKHKFTREPVPVGGIVTLYGVPVGKAVAPLQSGERITVDNVVHYAAEVDLSDAVPYMWKAPDVSRWANRTFDGVIRPDGRVGTANYWLIIPLVFCENRNALKLRDALERTLGYAGDHLADFARSLVGGTGCAPAPRPFPHIDGIRAITHNGGCGGTAQDAWTLCRMLAAYADHPNVAGLTVFSLGCEKAQIGLFQEALRERNLGFDKPCILLRQQDWSSEVKMMEEAVRKTLAHFKSADLVERRPVPLSKLKLGVKCGGSDGFSGISANPAIGEVSDRVVTLGGGSALAEFPELCGVEANMISRCIRKEDKARFLELMRRYEAAANFHLRQPQPREHPRRADHRCHQIGWRGEEGRQGPDQRRARLRGTHAGRRAVPRLYAGQRRGSRDRARGRGCKRGVVLHRLGGAHRKSHRARDQGGDQYGGGGTAQRPDRF